MAQGPGTRRGDAAGATALEETVGKQVAAAAAAQKRNAAVLAAAPNANGYGISITPGGVVFLNVLVERNPEAARAALPHQLDGIPVLVEEVGRIVAY